MLPSRYLSIQFIDTTFAVAETQQDTAAIRPWMCDDNAQESEAIALRNREIGRRLGGRFPGSQSSRFSAEDLEEDLDDDLSQEALLRRLHRGLFISFPWRGGEAAVHLFDAIAELNIQVVNLTRANRAAFQEQLTNFLAILRETIGMEPRDPRSGTTASPSQVATALLEKHARTLDRLMRDVQRARWRQNLGIPSLFILSLGAIGISAWLLWNSIERGTLMMQVDASAPVTFVTESLPPPMLRFGLIPQFTLEGRIRAEGPLIWLPVFRDEYLRAGPGAPYTVLPTHIPESPYVLRSAYDSTGPVLRIGNTGFLWTGLMAVLPLFLLYWLAWRPILRAPAVRRADRIGDATRLLGRTTLLAGAILAIAFLKGLL